MNSSYNISGKSPRKQIQGPRPAPLQVRKDSHMIRKPPVNVVSQHVSQSHSHRQHPPPVIIYTLSPKVYNVEPNEFRQLVQKLTGRQGTVGQSSSAVFDNNSGAISSAARFAATGESDIGVDIDEITDLFPGILSPPASSLPPIAQDIFAPSSKTNSGGKDYMDRHDKSSASTRSNHSFSPPPSSLPPIAQDIFAPSSETNSGGKNYMNRHDRSSASTHSNNSFSPKIMAYSPDSQDYFINFYDI